MAKTEIITLLGLVLFYVALGILVVLDDAAWQSGTILILAAGFLVASGATVWWNVKWAVSRAPSVHGLQRTPGNAFFFFFNVSMSLFVAVIVGSMTGVMPVPSSALGALYWCPCVAIWCRYKDRHTYEVFNADRDDVRVALDATLEEMDLREVRSKVAIIEQRITRVIQVVFSDHYRDVRIPEQQIMKNIIPKLPASPNVRPGHRAISTYSAARLSLTAPILAFLLVCLFL
ncbi:MAG TPA: hypothetical protein VKK79_15375 [Candidatus Lokiarchaeia archaeon]|nr:hypothetical protein [Candidatus Lokiarchaeia archaeon]